MICAAAACMMASFGEFGKVYRIGGDEFVVIVTQKPDELDTMTKHFDSSVAEWRGKIVNSMTISYGCVRSLEETGSLYTILRRKQTGECMQARHAITVTVA